MIARPDDLVLLATLILASWRVAVLLVYETGPWFIVQRLRERLGIEHADDGQPISWPDTFLGAVMGCVWCMTFYTSLAMWALLFWSPWPVVFLGAWGAATYLEALRTRE